MPRYFFNLRTPENHELDIEGMVLQSLHDAVEEADYAAEAAMALSSGTSGVFEIEDEGRVIVARVAFQGD